MELRQMPEIKRIEEYLRRMSFKRKVFGGCDTESVLDHLAAVTEMYEHIILRLLAEDEKHQAQTAEPAGRYEAIPMSSPTFEIRGGPNVEAGQPAPFYSAAEKRYQEAYRSEHIDELILRTRLFP